MKKTLITGISIADITKAKKLLANLDYADTVVMPSSFDVKSMMTMDERCDWARNVEDETN